MTEAIRELREEKNISDEMLWEFEKFMMLDYHSDPWLYFYGPLLEYYEEFEKKFT